MTSFEDLGIQDRLSKAVSEMGWTEPTDIQIAAVPEGLSGRDVFAQAQTGTGKTGTYALIALGRTGSGSKKPTTLILAPTRELALQIESEIKKIAYYTRHRTVAIYGGASINDQAFKLRKGVDIVVGTPGRVKDMIERNNLDLSNVKEAILDEADRMLDMGFSEDLNFILSKVPTDRQTLLFSATMSREIKELSLSYMNSPKEILVSKDEPCSDLTTQYFISLSRNAKKDVLRQVINHYEPKMIIFCQTKKMVDELFEDLSKDFRVGSIHGDMPQGKREKVITNFRRDKTLILVATDVAARGLDVNNIDCVLNYDVPNDSETYIHRIGRTGRAGKEGMAISFITKRDNHLLRGYENATGKRVFRMDLKSLEGKDVIERVAAVESHFVERAPDMDRGDFDRDSRPSNDFQERGQRRGGRSSDRGARAERPPVAKSPPKGKMIDEMTILKINLGKEDKYGRTEISNLLKSKARVERNQIGRIGLGGNASFFEIPSSLVEQVIVSISGKREAGKTIQVIPAPKKDDYHDRSKKTGAVASA